MKLVKTSEKLVSENYPYGFTMKTTKTDYIEFNKTHGFRHCSFTINPKTGRENKPKKSTYHSIMLLGKNEVNHTKSLVMEFYDQKDVDQIIEFFSKQENFELFTSEQIEYIYMKFLGYIKISIIAQVQYCGSELKDLKPLYDQAITVIVKGIKENGTNNYFNQISFDWDKINSLKVEGYQPFKVVRYGI